MKLNLQLDNINKFLDLTHFGLYYNIVNIVQKCMEDLWNHGTGCWNASSIIMRITSAFDAVYYKWCARYDIKDTTLFILERIYTAPERCTQKYLCETLSYPKQTISASLKQLEARGSSPAGRIRRTFAAT